MGLRPVVEVDVRRFLDFLTLHSYPAIPRVEDLRSVILVSLIDNSSGLIAGYVWASEPDPYVLDFHACLSPSWRGRWLTDDLYRDLETIARFYGARGMSTRTLGDRPARLVAALLQRRFGYTLRPDGSLYKQIVRTWDF